MNSHQLKRNPSLKETGVLNKMCKVFFKTNPTTSSPFIYTFFIEEKLNKRTRMILEKKIFDLIFEIGTSLDNEREVQNIISPVNTAAPRPTHCG